MAVCPWLFKIICLIFWTNKIYKNVKEKDDDDSDDDHNYYNAKTMCRSFSGSVGESNDEEWSVGHEQLN